MLAFAVRGKAPSIPGPLIRVRRGTPASAHALRLTFEMGNRTPLVTQLIRVVA